VLIGGVVFVVASLCHVKIFKNFCLGFFFFVPVLMATYTPTLFYRPAYLPEISLRQLGNLSRPEI
jgi:hypothetical protein